MAAPKLVTLKCAPCKAGTPPLADDRVHELLAQVSDWNLVDHAIQRTVRCENFKQACALFMEVALLCEEEGHHADIRVFGWRNIEFTLSTHKIGGLSENDFIVAAKINQLLRASIHN
ncbi:MAG: 4a-hydroxytetrahydrobiopterin dehydratase [bacterium]|nr:4a-hydroxytetrahydrobiopterin dehydratase [bacterium]